MNIPGVWNRMIIILRTKYIFHKNEDLKILIPKLKRCIGAEIFFRKYFQIFDFLYH